MTFSLLLFLIIALPILLALSAAPPLLLSSMLKAPRTACDFLLLRLSSASSILPTPVFPSRLFLAAKYAPTPLVVSIASPLLPFSVLLPPALPS